MLGVIFPLFWRKNDALSLAYPTVSESIQANVLTKKIWKINCE